MNNYLQRAQELYEEMLSNRRHLHRNPELGMETIQTAEFVKRKLAEAGIEAHLIGRNGVTAVIGKSGGKVILLRADMDALPLNEDSGLEFASENMGAAHCCGHDMHTAMLLSAAKMLKEREAELPGMVKLIFQPGEECLMGARNMLENGILENPKVDAALAIHANSLYESHKLLVFTGLMTAASNSFTINIQGHGSHGARPNESIDPINAACHIHSALQTINARELANDETAVLTIGSIQAGQAYNAIPDTAIMKGTLRTFNQETRDKVMDRLSAISENVAAAFRAKADVDFSKNYTVPLVCSPPVAKFVKQTADELLGRGQAVLLNRMGTASEDFAFIAEKVPSSFVVLGAAVGDKPAYGQHHPKVLFDESCMPIGAALYAQTAAAWLEEKQYGGENI